MSAVTQDDVQEIHLMPGDLFFGASPAKVSTLLGSCVSVVLWHPKRRIGGMCHYVLPYGTPRKGGKPGAYADAAIEALYQAVIRAGSRPREYRTTLVGGGHMFPMIQRPDVQEVGDRNIAAGEALLKQHGFVISDRDVGGHGHRHVDLDLATGAVHVRFELQPGAARCAPGKGTK
jgi:chemotaxis protein CheD